MMRTSRLTLAATLAVGLVAAAHADMPWPNISPPILLQLEGSVHDTPDAARKAGFAVLTVGFYGHSDVQRYFGVDDARTVGPETGLDGKDVLADLAPLRPNLLVTGPAAMVRTLLDLPVGGRVRMEGLVSRGSRTYYLRSIEPNPQPKEHSRSDGGRHDGRHHDFAVVHARAEGSARRR